MKRILAAGIAALALAPAAAVAALDDTAPAAATIAVIGDVPYGATQLQRFPSLVSSINDVADVRMTVHVGDIKSGSTVCSDAYFDTVKAQFDTFRRPLVYTPGDNEWTDCHRTNNGGYVPTERLAKLRQVFFPVAGQTMGAHPIRIRSQADDGGLVENMMWKRAGVVFSTAHIVGSNNNLAPWFGQAAVSPEQQAEYDGRLAADLEWIDATFDRAEREGARGVVLASQADMWDGTAATLTGFRPIVERIAERSRAFGRPVLLLEGDSHDFVADRPLTAGSPLHGVTTAAPNVTRIVVQGSAAWPLEWLRLTVDPTSPQVFTWSRVAV